MMNRVLISFFCDDRPGVIEQLSQAVEAADGNWLDSQLSRLGGRFAGVLQVEAPGAKQAVLGEALEALAAQGITAALTSAGTAPEAFVKRRRITLLGPDRPGIVQELTRALLSAGFNVHSLTTAVESAPWSGEPLFRAEARIELIEGSHLDELERRLDAMADAMTLDIDLLAE